MGVKYLNRFLHSYPVQLLEDIEVCDATIVIDGSELLYYLYFEWGKLDLRCGGEYSELRQITNDFVNALRTCGIKCFVVFDSFKSQNNITRYLKTRSEKLENIRKWVDHGKSEGRVQPLMGKDVLKQTLFDAKVPFVVVPGDGDAEIAAIANNLNAYVLSSDTDFCIFDLKRGFLLIPDLKWQNIHDTNNTCQGKIFRRDILQVTFGTPLCSVKFLVPLLSRQDGLSGVDFRQFLKNLSEEVPVPPNLRRGNFKRPDFIESILLWLAESYHSDEETIRLIKQKMSNLPEDQFRDCMLLFNELPNVETFVSSLSGGGHEPDVGLSCFEKADDGLPNKFLPIVPDDQTKPSANRASSQIRNAIYQIGFIRDDALARREMRDLKVREADREGYDYRRKNVSVDLDEESMQPMQLRLEPDQLMEHEDRMDIVNARREFVLKSLLQNEDRGELDVSGEGMKLLAVTLKYWCSLQDHIPLDQVRVALAITISCIYHRLNVPDALLTVKDDHFDKSALHFSTMWQVCIYDTMRLNNILGRPFVNPSIGKMFSGQMFQRAFEFLMTNDDLRVEDVSTRLFASNVESQDLFNDIVRLMKL